MLAGAALGAAILPHGIEWVVAGAAALETIAVALLIAQGDFLAGDAGSRG
jgi:hypothetical protein